MDSGDTSPHSPPAVLDEDQRRRRARAHSVGLALPSQPGDATAGDPVPVVPPSDAGLRASPGPSLAHVEVLRAAAASMDEFKRETLETLRALRAELEAERGARQALQRKLDEADDAFDQKLQQKLLDVDLVLPSAASARLLKKARAYTIRDEVLEDLADYNIVPDGGFDFAAERCLHLLLHPDEVSKISLRIPSAAGLPDPSHVDQPVYDSMRAGARSQFNRTKSEQERLLKQYNEVLAVSNVLCDESLGDDTFRIDLALRTLAVISQHRLHQFATQERLRIEAVGQTVNSDPDWRLPSVNWEDRQSLLTPAILQLLDESARFRKHMAEGADTTAKLQKQRKSGGDPSKRGDSKKQDEGAQPRLSRKERAKRAAQSTADKKKAADAAATKSRSTTSPGSRASTPPRARPNTPDRGKPTDTDASRRARERNVGADKARVHATNGGGSDPQ
eukprot:SAG31_NODE_97_length_25714_cov_19.477142_5_plen_449_part_00